MTLLENINKLQNIVDNMMKTKVSVVIAALNEAGNIKQLTERIIRTLEKDYRYEIIYSLAGTDNSLQILNQIKNKNIKISHSIRPYGLGHDFKKGFDLVSKDSEFIITMDADLNHQPEEIPLLLNKAPEFDIIIGSRGVKGSIRKTIPLWKRIISDFTNFVFSTLFRLKIKDKTSGFRIYNKKAFELLYKKYKCKNFEFLLEILLIAKSLDLSMTEVPITFKYRVTGQSKFRFFKVGRGYLKLLIRYIAR